MRHRVKVPRVDGRALIGARQAILVLSVALLGACSGGEKIVAPGAQGNTRLAAADSLYLANTLRSASFDALKNLRRMPITTVPGTFPNAPPCTPTSTIGGADANNNNIPDDRTTQYTATACTYFNNGITFTASGTVRVQDLGSITGYRVTYTAYTIIGTKGDSVTRTTLSGAFEYRWVSATSATSLDNTTLFIEVRSAVGSASLTRVANLAGTFTAAGGSTIGLSFPSGTFAVTGTLSLTGNATGNQVQTGIASTQTLSMSVSTALPLSASSSCSSDAAFGAGELGAAVSGSNQGAVQVRFTGCGQGAVEPPRVSPPGKR
jgi:hypothetical protein